MCLMVLGLPVSGSLGFRVAQASGLPGSAARRWRWQGYAQGWGDGLRVAGGMGIIPLTPCLKI